MNVVIITQARYGSTRLPGKVLKKISDKTMLDVHLERLKLSQRAQEVMVATTLEPGADKIVEIATSQGVSSYRGSTDDVLDRFYKAAQKSNADIVVRVTSDCPLNDGRLIDLIIDSFISSKVDYMSNTLTPSFADGLDIEVFWFKTLEKAWSLGKAKIEREHVTPYIYNVEHGFKLKNYDNVTDDSSLRITLDYEEDFTLICSLLKSVGFKNEWKDYINYLKKHPEIQVNRIRNETFNK